LEKEPTNVFSGLNNEDCYVQNSSIFELHDIQQDFGTD